MLVMSVVCPRIQSEAESSCLQILSSSMVQVAKEVKPDRSFGHIQDVDSGALLASTTKGIFMDIDKLERAANSWGTRARTNDCLR